MRGPPRLGDPARHAGAGDVRPHRARLRPHELGDDGRHAPSLARAGRGPGRRGPGIDARSTWRPAPATWRSSSRAAARPSRAWTSRPAMLELAREKAPELEFEEGDALGARATRTARSTPSPSASARATSATSTAGCAEMARVTRPAAGWWCSRSRLRSDRRCRGSSGPGSTASVPALGRLAGDPDAYSYLPVERAALSRARGAGGPAWRPAGLDRRPLDPDRRRDHRAALGHAARVNTAQAQLGAVLAAGGPELTRLLERDRGAARRGGARPRRGARRPRGRHAGGGRQAPAADPRVPVRRRATRRARGRPARRSSCSTWRRWCTTTCSTAPSCAAAARPCSRQRAARPPPPPGTCSSRARSRSSPRRAAEDAVRALSRASSALARGELMQRADAWDAGGDAGALPRALPAEDGQPVRRLLPARGAPGRASPSWPRRSGASASGSGSPSRCSTTCSTSPARRSGRASRAAPTCSTAR